MASPCKSQLDAYDDAIKDWVAADKKANSDLRTSGVTGVITGAVCTVGWFVVGPATAIGCVTSAGAFIHSAYEFIKAADEEDAAWEAYKDAKEHYDNCKDNHKWYYKYQ